MILPACSKLLLLSRYCAIRRYRSCSRAELVRLSKCTDFIAQLQAASRANVMSALRQKHRVRRKSRCLLRPTADTRDAVKEKKDRLPRSLKGRVANLFPGGVRNAVIQK